MKQQQQKHVMKYMGHKLQLQREVEEDKTSENREGLGATTERSCFLVRSKNPLFENNSLRSRMARQMILVLSPVTGVGSEAAFLKL